MIDVLDLQTIENDDLDANDGVLASSNWSTASCSCGDQALQ
ncbi:hypothetical protein [Salininema proteolyticum]|uniref:Uncharacterized protein n=1 Tax=Salininema proteolyticum TaxID=1607685 RepID=A0ABV8TZV5_9ACTN